MSFSQKTIPKRPMKIAFRKRTFRVQIALPNSCSIKHQFSYFDQSKQLNSSKKLIQPKIPSVKLTETFRQVVHTFPKDFIDPHVQQDILNRYLRYKETSPICVLHSRTWDLKSSRQDRNSKNYSANIILLICVIQDISFKIY